jgi:hypothetical protein
MDEEDDLDVVVDIFVMVVEATIIDRELVLFN